MKLYFIPLIFLCGCLAGYGIAKYIPLVSTSSTNLVSPVAPPPKPLAKYAFTSLQDYQSQSSPISLDNLMFSEADLNAYQAHFTTQTKNMSLQIMVPQSATPSAGFPVILLVRGFVDPSIYQTGIGTQNAARYFSSRGYVTISPDFLGFGDSDFPPIDAMEARLEKPAQLLDLIASLSNFSLVDLSRLGIWAHSNGGQIALSVLEITGQSIPTVLWAPVTKPFPYSMLYYTDEYQDGGKALRKVLADFELNYDVFDYSLDSHLDRLVGPIELHQGSLDDAVPQAWSDEFVEKVNQTTKKIKYFVYPASDHNLRPDWDTAVSRSYQFFEDSL